MSDILAKICADKKDEVAGRKAQKPWARLADEARAMPPARGFAAALSAKVAAGEYGLIAEIKKASPSAGLIRPDFDPISLAQAYKRAGAACLSVLTDRPYFQGEDDFLAWARLASDLPCLRKDFMVDPYQIVEARAIGADCVLLIMACLEDSQAAEMEALAFSLGLDVLIEVHDREELERALKHLKSPLVGINNRNLKTLKIDLAVTEELAPLLPKDRVLVAESGLKSPADLSRMAKAGARRFLIGESLMKQADVEAATRAILTRS